MGGISNFQIEKTFKNIGDDDLNDTFVGGFPSNYISKFVDHDSMISDKGKYLVLQIWTTAKNQAFTGGMYWTLS